MRRLTMDFLPDVEVLCEECGGRRFDRETLEVHFKGRDIAEVLDMSVDAATDLFASVPACRKILEVMQGVGLGYLRLGQAGATLSGGEAQRLKLVQGTGARRHAADPLHPRRADHRPALLRRRPAAGACWRSCSARGNTVVVIEHNPEVIRRADHVIDLGPEGGGGGGQIVAAGSIVTDHGGAGVVHRGDVAGAVRGRLTEVKELAQLGFYWIIFHVFDPIGLRIG